MAEAAPSIPGYRYGDPALPPSPVTPLELARLTAALLFSESDRQALRRAGEILGPRTEEILDVWYGFVGQNDFLVAYFAGPEGARADYLARVRGRFGRWIADTCRGEFDETWLAYQDEIGRRHHLGKNRTDAPHAEGTPPFVHLRYLLALTYPIYATVRPFLEASGAEPGEVERMHQAWLKAVLLQVILWSRAYVQDGTW